MEVFYKDLHDTLYNIDFRKNELPDNSIQCVVTSPPYLGLRKYSGEQELIWGIKTNPDGTHELCNHQWGDSIKVAGHKQGETNPGLNANFKDRDGFDTTQRGGFCSICGAWKGAYGLEPTPEMYVEHTIEILREIRRVLRKDGVVFWNIGDKTKNTATIKQGMGLPTPRQHDILKPKDLCLIPFRVAIAAQEDGWWVRSVIIWSKPNPMPESVTDRPTESHEYILMLTKSSRYYWDADAVREGEGRRYTEFFRRDNTYTQGRAFDAKTPITGRGGEIYDNTTGRNIRSVWEFPTQPYPEAHFAVFPEKLPEICIKAATPEVGCCSKCGAPWERVSAVQYHNQSKTETEKYAKPSFGTKVTFGRGNSEHQTLGWQPTCKCNANKVPSIVLDPFAGAGTTLWVAKKLNRKAIGYELSKEYCGLIEKRNRQQVIF